MRIRGKNDPEARVKKAAERFAEPENRAKLATFPHPSPFFAEKGRTLADYVEAKLGPTSQLGLKAKLTAIYEAQKALDGGTAGQIRDRGRDDEALKLLRLKDPVFSRRIPGRFGTVLEIHEKGEYGWGSLELRVLVKWNDGEETKEAALALVRVLVKWNDGEETKDPSDRYTLAHPNEIRDLRRRIEQQSKSKG